MPVRYIKIVPLQSWGPAYNYTIWYVELRGKNHEELLSNTIDIINLVCIKYSKLYAEYLNLTYLYLFEYVTTVLKMTENMNRDLAKKN